MNLLSKLFKRSKSPTDDYWYMPIQAPTHAGVKLDAGNSLNQSAVFNAINIISGTIGSLPLNLYHKDGDKVEVAEDRPIHKILHTKANPEMSAMSYRETVAAHVVSWGNGYSEVVRNKRNEVTALWPITPNRVRVMRAGLQLVYEIDMGGGLPKRHLPRPQVLHIPGLGFDGLMGYSVLTKAREAIALGLAVEEFGSRFFGEGTHPSAVVEHPNKVGPEAYDHLKKSLTTAYSGLGKAHRLMILEEGMKLNNIGIPPEDAQFLQTRQFQITEIARWFNIEPSKLKDHTRSTFSNIEHLAIDHVQDCLAPWLKRIEQAYNTQLLSEEQRKAGFYFEHIVEGLLRGDSASRAEFYSKMLNIGVLSINEIRVKENLNPIQGGDVHLVPLNLTPLELALEGPKPPAAPVPPGADDEGAQDDDEPNLDDEARSMRSVTERNRLRGAWEKLFRKTAQRVINRDVKAIRDATSVFLTRSKNDFTRWLDDYLKKLPESVAREFLPVLMSYADDVQAAASKEVNRVPGMNSDIDAFVRKYSDILGLRYAGATDIGLKKALEEAELEDIRIAVQKRLDLWGDNRSQLIANNETVRVENAISKLVFSMAGVASLVWVTAGNPCPYCEELSGKVVGIREPFIGEGSFNPPGADGSMKVNGPKFTPPLHRGCVCSIEPK